MTTEQEPPPFRRRVRNGSPYILSPNTRRNSLRDMDSACRRRRPPDRPAAWTAPRPANRYAFILKVNEGLGVMSLTLVIRDPGHAVAWRRLQRHAASRQPRRAAQWQTPACPGWHRPGPAPSWSGSAHHAGRIHRSRPRRRRCLHGHATVQRRLAWPRPRKWPRSIASALQEAKACSKRNCTGKTYRHHRAFSRHPGLRSRSWQVCWHGPRPPSG